MITINKLIFSLWIACSLLVISSGPSLASENYINISGYSFPRNRFAIATEQGNQLPPFLYYTFAGEMYTLIENADFSEVGNDGCLINFNPFVPSVTSGLLVDSDNNLLIDLFWAGASSTDLTSEEVDELIKFVNAGGILYISGSVVDHVGLEYDDFFEALSVDDCFSSVELNPGPLVKTGPPLLSTPITNGPFGIVENLAHGKFVKFSNNWFNGIFSAGGFLDEFIILEKALGSGYLVISGDTIYSNEYLLEESNADYFLNMVALACDYNNPPEPPDPWEDAVVLPMTTFYKQYDDAWGNETYDAATKQTLDCGTTIEECGCAMTSAANLMKYWGINYTHIDSELDPYYLDYALSQYTFGNLLKDDFNYQISFGYDYGLVLWNSIAWISNLASYKYPEQVKLDLPVIQKSFNLGIAKSEIDNGRPVLLKVRNAYGGEHWVMVFGYLDDELIISDPAMPEPEEGYNTLTSLGYSPAVNAGNENDSVMVLYKEAHTDYSSLQIASISPAKTVIVNNEGEKTGYWGEVWEEIDNSNYYFEGAYADIINGNYPNIGAGYYTSVINTPTEGEYEIGLGDDPEEFCQFTMYVSNSKAESDFVTYDTCELQKIYFDPESEEIFWENELVDIKPQNVKNFVNMFSEAEFQIGVVSDDDFDATKINFESVRVEGVGPVKKMFVRDINNDKVKDAVFHFRISDFELGGDVSRMCLFGESEGRNFYGCDDIKLVTGLW